jgi:PP-loop superfamily ATP-utilizing enzyme
MGDARKIVSVALKPRHQKMLDAMPGVQIADITRKALEEMFESRNEREFARISIEEDLVNLVAEWERVLGVKTGITITDTEDGFRVVLIPLKKYTNG